MADLTLPLTGVSGAGAVGTTIPSVDGGSRSLTLAGVAGAATPGSTVPSFTASLTGVSGIGKVGAALTPSQMPGELLKLAMPAFTLSLAGTVGAIGGVALTFPKATLAIAGVTSLIGSLALRFPVATLAASGTTGTTGSLALHFPAAKLAMGGGNSLSMPMPRASLALAGTTGTVGALSLNLPHWSLAATGAADAAGAAVLAFPALRMAITGDSGRAGRLALTLQALQLALTGTTGAIGSLDLKLPIFKLALGAAEDASGSLILTVPSFHLQLSGSGVLVAGQSQANATTLVMQTERGALTQYTHFPFNSFAAFNGVFLGASDDGVFALTGADDAGVAIAAAARVGTTDFGTSHLKRIERIYVGYRSTGRMILRVVTEERWTRDYALAPATHAGLHGAHVRLGRGLEARYWQFEVQNDAGGDFDLDMLEMKPTKLKRRVGGGNA